MLKRPYSDMVCSYIHTCVFLYIGFLMSSYVRWFLRMLLEGGTRAIKNLRRCIYFDRVDHATVNEVEFGSMDLINESFLWGFLFFFIFICEILLRGISVFTSFSISWWKWKFVVLFVRDQLTAIYNDYISLYRLHFGALDQLEEIGDILFTEWKYSCGISEKHLPHCAMMSNCDSGPKWRFPLTLPTKFGRNNLLW